MQQTLLMFWALFMSVFIMSSGWMREMISSASPYGDTRAVAAGGSKPLTFGILSDAQLPSGSDYGHYDYTDDLRASFAGMKERQIGLLIFAGGLRDPLVPPVTI